MRAELAPFLQVPYLDIGRDPAVGLDCWGMVKAVRETVYGLATPDYADQCDPDQTDRFELIEREAAAWQRVDEPQPGDMVLFRIGRHLRHAGVVVGTAPLTMINTTDGIGASIEALDQPRWRSRVAGFYRAPIALPANLKVAEAPVKIRVYAHPLKADSVEAEAASGASLAVLLGDAASHFQASVNGVEVPREWWPRVRPKPGAVVDVRAVPQRFIRRIRRLLSRLAPHDRFVRKQLKKLLTPPLPKLGQEDSFNRRNALTGVRNEAAPYRPIPRVFGRMRYFPPFAALPFTETVGEIQYLRALLMLGYGPLTISDIRIGTTPISEYEGVEMEIGPAPALFANDVSEEQFEIVLNAVASTATRTTALGIDEFHVDLVFGNGLFATDDRNRTRTATVRFLLQYRAAGSGGAWINPVGTGDISYSAGWISRAGTDDHISLIGMTRETRMAGIRVKVPNGQYEVRLTRATTVFEIGSPEATYADCAWSALRGITYTLPSVVPNTVLLALRIRSTDQLNGVIDAINLIAEAHLPVWNGSAWVVQPTRSPAWAYVDVFCGIATERAVNRDAGINLAAIVDWAAECTTRGRTFDAVIDAATTVFELAGDIASVGRAAFSQRDGRITVVRDEAVTVPVQWFTPRNTSGFRRLTSRDEAAHAVRVRFVNPALDWQQDEIVVPAPGYTALTATRFETLQLRGVTSPQQAWYGGVYFLASAELRRSNYSLSVDVENLVAQRGDLVGVVNERISAGLGAGRIRRIVTNGGGAAIQIEIDEFLTLQAGTSYALRVRLSNGTSVIAPIAAAAGETNLFVLNSPLGGVQIGDLAMVGTLGSESRMMRVVLVEPQSELSANVSLVDDAPSLRETQNLTPPAFPPPGEIVIDPSLIRCCPPNPTIGSGGMQGDSPTTNPGGSPRPVIRVMIP